MTFIQNCKYTQEREVLQVERLSVHTKAGSEWCPNLGLGEMEDTWDGRRVGFTEKGRWVMSQGGGGLFALGNLGLYPESNGTPLKDFKHGGDRHQRTDIF